MIRLLSLIKPEYLDWYLAKDKSGMVFLYKEKPTRDKDYWRQGDTYIGLFDIYSLPLVNVFEKYDYRTKPITVRELVDRKYFEKTGKKFDLKSYSKERKYTKEDIIKYHTWALLADGKETIILDGHRTFLDENLRHLKSCIDWEVDI